MCEGGGEEQKSKKQSKSKGGVSAGGRVTSFFFSTTSSQLRCRLPLFPHMVLSNNCAHPHTYLYCFRSLSHFFVFLATVYDCVTSADALK
jgi:hypothetical protein